MSNQDHYYLIEYSEATNDNPAILKITPFKSSERDKETGISKASTADTRLTTFDNPFTKADLNLEMNQ